MKSAFMKAVVALSILSVPALPASAADTTCAAGFVNKLEYGANSNNSHDPWIQATVNSKLVYIGMNKGEAKDRAEMSDMRATLLSSLLANVSVSIIRHDGNACTNDKNQTQNKISIIVQSKTSP